MRIGSESLEFVSVEGRGMIALSVGSKPLSITVTPDMPVSVPSNSVIIWSGSITARHVSDRQINELMHRPARPLFHCCAWRAPVACSSNRPQSCKARSRKDADLACVGRGSGRAPDRGAYSRLRCDSARIAFILFIARSPSCGDEVVFVARSRRNSAPRKRRHP